MTEHNQDSEARPPRLAQRLLEAALPEETDGRSILGDLHQEFLDRCRTGQRSAAVWYWLEALRLCFGFLVFRGPKRSTRTSSISSLRLTFDSLGRDIGYGLRRARRRPLFSLVAVGSLGIGIGACTMIFSVISATLLQSAPEIKEPKRVAEIWRTQDGHGLDTLSYPDVVDLRSELVPKTFERVSVYIWDMVSASEGGDGDRQAAKRLSAMYVSADYLPTLGVQPTLGQGFSPAWDESEPSQPVAVVSRRLWREHYPNSYSLDQQSIRLGGREHAIVGVLPGDFRGHLFGFQPDVLLPIGQHAEMHGPDGGQRTSRRGSFLFSLGKLAPGVSISSASQNVDAVYQRLETQYPQSNRGRGGQVTSYGLVPGGVRTPISGFFAVLLGLGCLVLLITCANVAGMLLASAATRTREMALRLAVGSSRRQLIRQLICESALLFLAGGFLGTFLSFAAARLIGASRFTVLPIAVDLDLTPDWRVLLFSLLITSLGALVFGLLPAFQSTRGQVGMRLRSAVSSDRFLARRALVVTQVAASMVLLVTAGLFLRSVQEMANTPKGFETKGVLTASVDLELDGLDTSAESGIQLFRQLEQALQAIPGVESAAFATDMPLDLATNGNTVLPEGWSGEDTGFSTSLNRVSTSYVETLNAQLLEGRALLETDALNAEPIGLVGREFAQRAWPDQSAVGKWVELSWKDPAIRVRIVGVLDDVKSGAINEPPRPTLFLPLEQSYAPSVHVFVRGSAPNAVAQADVAAAILQANPNLSHTFIQTLEQAVAMGSIPQRAAAWIATVLGAIALLLSSLGLYGVISFSVTSRNREIGVRMALGAWRSKVLGTVIRDAALLALPGLAIGLGLSLAVAQVTRSFLVGVSPTDTWTLFAATTCVVGVLLIASLVPATRAAAIDPAGVLRSD